MNRLADPLLIVGLLLVAAALVGWVQYLAEVLHRRAFRLGVRRRAH